MTAALALALAGLVTGGSAPGVPAPTATIAAWLRSGPDRPRVTLWLDREDPYDRGDRARVYFRLEQDAYVTVVRIDTDGRIRILFPLEPWEDGFARAGKTYEVVGRGRDEAFRVTDYPGVGYVFAIASEDPFDFSRVTRGDHWDYRAISDGRVRGDPYVAVTDLAAEIAPGDAWDYDVAEYYVERRYDYPRFVCYDCHTYASYYYWDPYSTYCSRFRIVIYNDPFYYPYRYYPYRFYGGTRVVFVRPIRPGPRYVFKDRDPRNDYITRVAQRPRTDDRRVYERDRTSADVGGRGAVPAPVAPRPRGGAGAERAEPRSPPSSEERRAEPRRRLEPDRGGLSPDTRVAPERREEGAPDLRGRRTSPPQSDSDGLRSAPAPAPERRRSADRDRDPVADRRRAPEDEVRPPASRGGERRPEAREAAPERRDAPRREEPADRGTVERSRRGGEAGPGRAPEVRREPSRERPAPRSTGEPELKRRRP
ncbi:MAG TPA: DUF4384 domain-containing protein [Gemmatimonadales bacterium]|jgi:hypothetical protein|nr:DUF4384 domain-containing protein [Gemmatimonadales bacterium]